MHVLSADKLVMPRHLSYKVAYNAHKMVVTPQVSILECRSLYRVLCSMVKGRMKRCMEGYWKTMRGSARLTSRRRKIMLICLLFYRKRRDLAALAARMYEQEISR